MLKYQRKTFSSFFHLHSIDHVMLSEEEELPIEIDVTIKNNEIELPATIALDYLAQPIFAIEISPGLGISDRQIYTFPCQFVSKYISFFDRVICISF